MLPGYKYRVTFKTPRSSRTLVGFYLGKGFGGYQFDLRPKAGTAVVRPQDLLYIRQTSEPIKVPTY